MANGTGQPTDPPPGPPATTPPEPPPRRRRSTVRVLLVGLLVGLLLVLAGAGGGAWWLWHSPTALQALLPRVPGLQVDGVQGRLGGGPLTLRRLQWQGAGLQISVDELAWDDLRWRWRPQAGAWLGAELQRPRAARVQVLTTPAPPGQPPSPPPQTLQLPFTLQARGLQIAELQLDRQPPVTDIRVTDLHLGADAGRVHRLQGLALQREGWRVSGQAQLGSDAPLPLQATLALRPAEAQAQGGGQAGGAQAGGVQAGGVQAGMDADVQVDGPLQRLVLQARVRHARGLAATLQATVAPWAPWPLLAASAQADDLDLAALSPGLPQTRLSGRARLAEAGRGVSGNDPLALDLALDNSLPGAWDSGRLPLRRLRLLLRGQPDQPGRLAFEQVEATLAGTEPAPAPRARTAGKAATNGRGAAASGAVAGGQATGDGRAGPAAVAAGELTGSGRWQDGRLALDLRLAGLRPERLDSRAPPMTLDGRIGLDIDGLPGPGSATTTDLHATLQADLAGRLPQRRAPPLQLQLRADLARSADGSLRLQLPALQAHAGGSSARGSADARRSPAGAWALKTDGTLTGFDPAPWWPAAAVGRGRAQLNGAWQADLSLAADAPATAGTPATPPPASSNAPPLAQPAITARGAAAEPGLAALLGRLRGSARLRLDDSRWAGLDWRGQADLAATGPALLVDADLRAGPNRLRLNGRLPTGVAGGAADTGSPAGPGRDSRGRTGPASPVATAPVPEGQIELQAPTLAALAPLADLLPGAQAWWPRRGALQASARLQGRWPSLRSQGSLQASGLDSPALQLGRADARWTISSDDLDAPLQLQLQASNLVRGVQRLDRLDLALEGSVRAHRLQLSAASPLRPPAWTEVAAGVTPPGGSTLTLQADGRWLADAPPGHTATRPPGPSADRQPATPAPAGGAPGQAGPAGPAGPALALANGRWQLDIQRLVAAPRATPDAPWLQAGPLQATLQLADDGALRQASLAPGRLQAFGATLVWQQAAWQAPVQPGAAPVLQLQAALSPMPVAPWLARFQPELGWQGDLMVGARIDLRSAASVDADVVVERTGGDLSLTIEGATRALQLSDLRLALAAHGGRWQMTQAVVGGALGVVGGQQTIVTTPQAAWPDPAAPLDGGISLVVPQLAVWAPWLPPGWRLGGALRIGASLGGRFAAPEYRGQVDGEDLTLRNLFEGIHLQQGRLQVALTGTEATVQRFEFRDGSGQGRLQVGGSASFGESPRARLRAQADKLRLLDRYDRRISVSGATELTLQDSRVALAGNITVDEGLVDATQADAPALGSDIVVVNRAPLTAPGPAAAAPAARPPGAATSPLGAADVDLRLNLGPALRLRGRGLDTLLRGQLRITTPQGRLAVDGTVRAEQGTYTAYGQNLAIERGQVIFSGDVANPVLDILALRADIDNRVGVVVTGSTTNPRVRLYSEPELGQLDTLTWLVLGRAPEGLGRDDTALLQRAALALLAGERSGNEGLLQRLGLDELSLSRSAPGTATGSGTGDTIISLGKQISRRVYVGYEHALGATGGTLQLIYRVAGRLTLRARTGEENALDAIWTWRWD